MELVTQGQILEETVCISFCIYALGKGMNPSQLFVKRKFISRVEWAL